MTAYETLQKARREGAHTIEVKERDSDKEGGVADLTPSGDVAVFHGADDGSDDTVVTPDEFNARFEITSLVFT